MSRIVIVGAGLAGMRAAERLRELGHPGEVVVLGSETSMPYHRPALSKQFLTGELSVADLRIESFDDLDVGWRLDTPVSQLDPGRRVLHLPGGEELGYDGLIIATGVEARRMPGAPHGHPRVVTLRTVADAKRIQRALAGNRAPVVMLGSGFTGCEITATLRSIGRDVTIVGRTDPLMGNLLGAELGYYITDLHERRGVNLELGSTITDWAPGPRNITVRLSNGRVIEAACVVVAVGSVPAVRWLRDSGVPVADGVVCDETCHVSGFEDMMAAGDVASWPNLRFDTRPRRTEHWTNATEMGRAAAENLLAGRSAARPFQPVPRFWSEQHGLHIQAAGVPALGTERVTQPGAPLARSVTQYLHNGRLMGVVGFDNAAAVLSYADDLTKLGPLARGETRAPAAAGRRRSFLESVRSA